MESAEPLIAWPKPIVEYLGFIAAFLAAGAIGLHFGVLRRVARAATGEQDWKPVLDQATRRASLWGLAGATITLALLAYTLPQVAARRHLEVAAYVAGNPLVALQVVLALAAAVGFALARKFPLGWAVAALAVIASPLRAAFIGQWARTVNPVHELAGGLWIGTLFLMLTAGLGTVLTSPLATERRGALAARIVNAFSPLALGAAGLLATFGVITAVRHLKQVDNLWRTPYGNAFLVKLGVVAIVVGLGAWNWRRQKSRLGSEAAAQALGRTGRVEVMVAAVVLAITAVLVSLPEPR
jgi:putative copper export protein